MWSIALILFMQSWRICEWHNISHVDSYWIAVFVFNYQFMGIFIRKQQILSASVKIKFYSLSLSLCNFFCCRSPKISLCNATGISDEDLNKLQNELQLMAADLVGEVRFWSYCNMAVTSKINRGISSELLNEGWLFITKLTDTVYGIVYVSGLFKVYSSHPDWGLNSEGKKGMQW